MTNDVFITTSNINVNHMEDSFAKMKSTRRVRSLGTLKVTNLILFINEAVHLNL